MPFSPGTIGEDVSEDDIFTTAVALVDLDNDGFLDLITGSFAQSVRSYMNDGSGGFEGGTILPVVGDGIPEALLSGSGPVDGILGALIPPLTMAIAVGDVDGDTFPDVVVGNYGVSKFSPNRLFFNNGEGTFRLTDTVELGVMATSDVELRDIDGDGDLDLVIATLGEGTSYRLNNGQPRATFAFGPLQSVQQNDAVDDEGDYTTSIELADLDGDSDLDLVVANIALNLPALVRDGLIVAADLIDDARVAVSDLVASGIATLQELIDAGLLDGTGTVGIRSLLDGELADLQELVDAELFGEDALSGLPFDPRELASREYVAGAPSRIYLNRLNESLFGRFVHEQDLGGRPTRAVAVGDVDGDSDVDVVLGNLGAPSQLYLNSGDRGDRIPEYIRHEHEGPDGSPIERAHNLSRLQLAVRQRGHAGGEECHGDRFELDSF